jgi:hypothetical protein
MYEMNGELHLGRLAMKRTRTYKTTGLNMSTKCKELLPIILKYYNLYGLRNERRCLKRLWNECWWVSKWPRSLNGCWKIAVMLTANFN